ncbi:MAG: Gfo/Idh/MocA family oxidoreductase, partial [Chloroflexi bacterium]|nr:Gfo/Idh/MocA family oxidoreductase [Chloroflexota bacterium]
MKKWKIALVGAGTIAKDHYMPQIQAMENAELVAVADTVPDAVEYAQKEFGIPKGYTNLDKM